MNDLLKGWLSLTSQGKVIQSSERQLLIELTIVAKTGQKSQGLEINSTGLVVVRVGPRPIKGQANQAIIELLGELLGLSGQSLELRKGEHSKNKIIIIDYQFNSHKGPDHYLEKLQNAFR